MIPKSYICNQKNQVKPGALGPWFFFVFVKKYMRKSVFKNDFPYIATFHDDRINDFMEETLSISLSISIANFLK